MSLFDFCWTLPVGEIRRVFVGCFIGNSIQTVQAAAAGEFEWTFWNLFVLSVGSLVSCFFFLFLQNFNHLNRLLLLLLFWDWLLETM